MNTNEISNGASNSGKRKSRAKNHDRWNKYEEKSNGRYTEMMHKITAMFPNLTVMEVKICVLLWDLKRGKDIAEIFETTDQTIYNHCTEIREKIRLKFPAKFHSFFHSIFNASET